MKRQRRLLSDFGSRYSITSDERKIVNCREFSFMSRDAREGGVLLL